MRISRPILLSLLICCASLMALSVASADVLLLKNGRAITGTFQGADQGSVTFQSNGQSRQYRVIDITSITFTSPDGQSSSGGGNYPDNRSSAGRRADGYNDPYNGPGSPIPSSADSAGGYPDSGSSAPEGRPTLRRRNDSYGGSDSRSDAPRPAPRPAPSSTSAASQPQPYPEGATIHAGSVITVRMIDPVDSSVDQIGQTFRATLDEPLVVDGQTVIPRGADVTAKLVSKTEAGRVTGRSELNLVLMDITVSGRRHELTTSEVTESGSSRGKQSAERVGVGTVLGAAIGAIAGGGKGAAIGAATGAGAGTAVQLATHGEKVKIPAETRLDFTLAQPLNL